MVSCSSISKLTALKLSSKMQSWMVACVVAIVPRVLRTADVMVF